MTIPSELTAEPPTITSHLTLADATKPIVTKETISFTFKGDRLDKDKGNWKKWSSEVLDLLDMAGLGSHLTDDISRAPSSTIQPNAHRNWVSNDRSVRGFLRSSLSPAERDLVSTLVGAKETWEKLETYHLEEGPIKQANLIQSALTMRIDRDDQMMTKVRCLRDDLHRAFRMQGGINKETFISIVVLQALGTGLDHSRAIIQRDFRASTPSSPYTVDHLVDFLEQEYQMLMGDRQRGPNNDSTVALAAQSFQKTKVICANCKRPGHSAPWCVCPNGGMAGKSIAE
ncbi:hypothetical protein BYT27DRAFT_7091975, partial [Phlegmacium glaucopus]